MKEKYITDLVGTYYLLPEGVEVSDIATSKTGNDIACGVNTEDAKKLVADRDKLIDALIIAINSHGNKSYEVFSNIKTEIYDKK